MRKWLNNYFDMSKREFNGMSVLVALIFCVLLAPLVYTWLWPFQPDSKEAERAIAELEKAIAAQKGIGQQMPETHSTDYFSAKNRRDGKPGKRVQKLFPFDPNTTDQQGWQRLGFSEKQAKVILNYRNKGGKFRKTEDLQQLYVISPKVYEQLRPFVVIKATVSNEQGHATSRVTTKKPPASFVSYAAAAAVMVEINRADTLELDKISGIGPAFARRIVKYRERLGGFYKREQLMEVFGLDSLKFNEIKDQVKVDISVLKMLHINSAKFEDLRNHPYLRYKQINAIIQYREQHGNYGNFADLKKVANLSPDLLERLAPYISFSP